VPFKTFHLAVTYVDYSVK